VEGERLYVSVAGDADYAASILQRLVSDGVKVSSFSRAEASVEEIYMQICGHQVS
jgi:hypothetical protein